MQIGQLLRGYGSPTFLTDNDDLFLKAAYAQDRMIQLEPDSLLREPELQPTPTTHKRRAQTSKSTGKRRRTTKKAATKVHLCLFLIGANLIKCSISRKLINRQILRLSTQAKRTNHPTVAHVRRRRRHTDSPAAAGH